MTKKTTKKPTERVAGPRYTTEEVKRYLGALSEDYTAKVDTIAEQYFGLNGKIDGGLAALNEKIDSVTEMVGKLAEDMTVVKQNIEFIKGDLRKKVDYDEFASLERRVAVLERKR